MLNEIKEITTYLNPVVVIGILALAIWKISNALMLLLSKNNNIIEAHKEAIENNQTSQKITEKIIDVITDVGRSVSNSAEATATLAREIANNTEATKVLAEIINSGRGYYEKLNDKINDTIRDNHNDIISGTNELKRFIETELSDIKKKINDIDNRKDLEFIKDELAGIKAIVSEEKVNVQNVETIS